ncbi:hypothetical protein OH76DRAFT_1488774 [Lentinus brumalis]|uniref:ATP-dependent RNA helicase n=1 Tax=Lentinus brumalis TaxID=2498619 RepID=A0A371CPQ9_9APHY|nr:hypothetical protein OH76DRAFT_1488774 [Polyporus brumalis]
MCLATLPSFTGSTDHVVRPFNANLSHKYCTEAMEKFCDGTILILICTDTAGMGCNVRDVDMVVQWKLPATLSNFIQRARRAACGPHRSGIAVLLVEPLAFTQLDPGKPRPKRTRKTKKEATAALDGSQPASQQRTTAQKKRAKDYAVAHGFHGGTHSGARDAPPTGVAPALNPDAPDEGLALVQSVRCRRQIWMEVYKMQDLARPVNKTKLHAILGTTWVWWEDYGDKLAAYMFSPIWDGVLGPDPGYKAFGYVSTVVCIVDCLIKSCSTEGMCNDTEHYIYYIPNHLLKEGMRIMADYRIWNNVSRSERNVGQIAQPLPSFLMKKSGASLEVTRTIKHGLMRPGVGANC